MQFLIEMEMNSLCHTTQHFNYVQEEWASKEAIILIIKVKKKTQTPNSLLEGKGIHSIGRAEVWFNAHILGKELRWADETKRKTA